jgi:hypothetical protein
MCRDGAGTAILPEHLRSPMVFSGVRVARSLVLCVVLCRFLFVLFLLVTVLSVFDLRIRITPLVSSNSSLFNIYISRTIFIKAKTYENLKIVIL